MTIPLSLTEAQITPNTRDWPRLSYLTTKLSDEIAKFSLATLTASIVGIHATTHADLKSMINGVSFETRAHWMRLANQASSDISGSPCPFAAFWTVIVNHTDSAAGKLICMGINEIRKTGNPTLHGKS
jgi:hypothetical protein